MTHPTPPQRNSAEQALLNAALIDLVERKITFNQVLGLKVQSLRPQFVVRFDMRPELVGHDHYQRLHGGVIASALDATAGCALMQAIADKHPADSTDQVMHRFLRMGTIDLRVDFLRQGLGQHFIVSAEVTRLGGRVASTQMRLINNEGTLIATGAGAYIVS